MELPQRAPGDQLLRAGELLALRERLRRVAPRHDLKTVTACAFDHRTRMLPFLFADLHMVPAGVRAIGSALVDAGFANTRIVLQQWNPHFRPSEMRLDGQVPDLFMVSSMLLHSRQCEALLRDACRLDAAQRPLVIAGGPKVIYEPWSVFSADPSDPWAADVAVTGEEYVLLELLEVVLSHRGRGESLRTAFLRARDSGALDHVPGLVYARGDQRGVPEALVDTGIQRLLGDLDELPLPVLGYQLLEPPSRRTTLGPTPLPAAKVRRHSPIGSLVLTFGCPFKCPYCPIPAYHQRHNRSKSGERIADEFEQLYETYGMRIFFGADDNFFADQQRALEIGETLARRVNAGSRAHCEVRWATEATVHHALMLREHLPLLRRGGLWAIWTGVEDLSGELVKKGQHRGRTEEAFAVLRAAGILPMPMLMHSDAQPLYTWHSNRGLLNQLGTVRRAGALYTQVLMLTPSQGSSSFEAMFESGAVIAGAASVPVRPALTDGVHVVASQHPRPWVKQLNVLAGYAFFFNPLRLLWALVRPLSLLPAEDVVWLPPAAPGEPPSRATWAQRLARRLGWYFMDAGIQAFGVWGVAKTVRATFGWAWHLFRGPIVRRTEPPLSRLPMRDPTGAAAAHALPGTPLAALPAEPDRHAVAAAGSD